MNKCDNCDEIKESVPCSGCDGLKYNDSEYSNIDLYVNGYSLDFLGYIGSIRQLTTDADGKRPNGLTSTKISINRYPSKIRRYDKKIDIFTATDREEKRLKKWIDKNFLESDKLHNLPEEERNFWINKINQRLDYSDMVEVYSVQEKCVYDPDNRILVFGYLVVGKEDENKFSITKLMDGVYERKRNIQTN